MKVSIIVPVFNAQNFLSECYNSIINQTYKNIEIIFINDCSSDNSYYILNNLSQTSPVPCKIINNNKNLGAAKSRNKGIQMSKGDYIFFMDVDDTITPDCIYLLTESANHFNNPDVICANFHSEDYTYKPTNIIKYLSNNRDIRHAYFNHECYEMPWNKLIRRDYLFKNTLFFENIYHEDTPWSFRLALTAQSMVLLPQNTYNYRVQESSKMSIRKDIKKIISDQYESFKSMYNAASEAEDNENAILYLTYICNSHMFAIVRTKGIPISIKKKVYKLQKGYTSYIDAFNGIKSSYIPIGIKIVLLYRLFPLNLGYLWLLFLSKIKS